jgi:EAL domain-containing protein (putative c-di-GMP-specific phosphodiesterase class I)
MHSSETLDIAPLMESPLSDIERVPENLPHDQGVFEHDGYACRVCLQPKLTDWETVGGYEALCHDVVTGEAAHKLFEEAAENGTLHLITKQILNQTAEAFTHGIHVPISCNISASEFTQEFVEVMESVRNGLVRQGIDPNLLELEILETEPVMDEQVPYILTLHNEGVHFLIDDFGTEYANIPMVQKLLDAGVKNITIKLDRSLALNGTALKVARELRDLFGDIPLVAEGLRRTGEVDNFFALEHTSVQSFDVGGKPAPLADWIRRIADQGGRM